MAPVVISGVFRSATPDRRPLGERWYARVPGPRRRCRQPWLGRALRMYVYVRRAKYCEMRGGRASALALLVAQVVADDHDPTVTADHLALVADLLDARLDLHGMSGSPGQCHHPAEAGRGQDLLVSVDDPATRQVVRRELHHDPVVREDTDVVHPHLAGDVREDLVTVLEFHLEHGVREGLDHGALNFDGTL